MKKIDLRLNKLGDHQIAFEKAVWFSEDIIIHKGYELQNNFSSVEAFINSSWKEGVKAECSRFEKND